MKILSVIFVFSGLYYFNVQKITNGQSLDYPGEYYKPIVFDYTLRGEFNISDCLKELLTCWELVRPEVICHDWIKMESICTWMRDLCHEAYGDLNIGWFEYVADERECSKENFETRKK